MDCLHAQKIEASLKDDDLVIDVGGGMAAFARADWIIDALPFDEQGKLLRESDTQRSVRFQRNTWVQFDLCSRKPWPFEDKQFDFAVCSHVLEDVRDPIWVCSEISRIAKAGYVEVPSRALEQSTGIEHPKLAGYYHHRWLVSINDQELEFRQKPHLLHVTPSAIVTKVGFWKTINPKHQFETFYWTDELSCCEILEFDEAEVIREMNDQAELARQLPDLLVTPDESWKRRMQRAAYFLRLRMAG
ncbi:MAG: methyltransferase domain-containing protein [Planctomycetota bacterium]